MLKPSIFAQFSGLYDQEIDCCEVLKADHQVTLNELQFVEVAISEQQPWSEIEAVFCKLLADLKPHYQCEEQGLFPVLSRHKTMILLEVEHDELLELEEKLGEIASQQDPNMTPSVEFTEAFAEFAEGLRGHICQENEKIFPMAQSLLEPEEHLLVSRRCFEIRSRFHDSGIVSLNRPVPQFQQAELSLFGKKPRPIRLDKLWEREHASVHHIELKAGKGFATHWAGQHQFLMCLTGSVEFLVPENPVIIMTPGHNIALDSRLRFSLNALEDSHLVVFKVWPRPHFTKPERGYSANQLT